MTHNVGKIDGLARLVVGSAVFIAGSLGYLGPWAWLGLPFAFTGVFHVCPLYLAFGINTCGSSRESRRTDHG